MAAQVRVLEGERSRARQRADTEGQHALQALAQRDDALTQLQ